MKKRVVVAMSGGVDSSVCAALLKNQGFEVVGLFMKLWSPKEVGVENRCCNIDALEGARRVAAKLDIPFYVVDLTKEFKKYVFNDYIEEYSICRTPNPCVICNKFIKFDLLLKKAFSLGAEYLATGHYVRLRRKSEILSPKSKTNSKCKIPNFKLLTAVDNQKDQSYFLWTLTQNQLKHLLFPIGDYLKTEVRSMAKKWDLPTAARADSQGLCFIGYNDNQEFLKKFVNAKPGLVKDLKGNILGKYQGLPLYTIGQRKGLPELIHKNSKTPPLYVIKLDYQNNTLIIGEEKDLYQKELGVEKVNWVAGKFPKEKKIGARIRYGHPVVNSKFEIRYPKDLAKRANPKFRVVFDNQVRAITPGQSIVFYHNEEVLGGGIIC